MGTFVGPNIVTDGLVFAVDAGSERSYPGTGSTWYDLSGNGLDMTMVGTVTWNSAGYFTGWATANYLTVQRLTNHFYLLVIKQEQ